MPQHETTLICSGYTAAGYLAIGNSGYQRLCLTNYSATFRKTPLQSQGMNRFGASVNNIYRTKGAFILGVPTIECNINFDASLSLLTSIVDTLKNSRNTAFKMKLTDEASDIEWIFDECYLSNFSFGVQRDSILSVSMTFFVQPNTVSYSYGNRELIARGTNRTLPLTQPVPYYEWKISMGNEIKDILEFSFSYSQNITPKYECEGTDSVNAPIARNLLFELPTMEFEYTQLLSKSGLINVQSSRDTKHRNDLELNNYALSVEVMNRELFELTGLELIEYSPVPTDTPSIKKVFSVNGTIK